MIQTRNRYFMQRATIVYLLSLVCCCVLFFSSIMTWYWILIGIIEVSAFYYFSSRWEVSWRRIPIKDFEKRIFWTSVLIRLGWTLVYYIFTMNVWHTPWEQPIGTTMDSPGYFSEAMWVYEMIRARDLSPYFSYVTIGGHLDDIGYPFFLALSRFIFNDSIFLTRIPNAIFDSWTVVLTYRIAKRNFGEEVGRLSSFFVILLPMMIFFSGVTMKETLMLMLGTWAVERGDYIIQEKQYRFGTLGAFLVLTLSLVLFRMAYAWVVMLAFICALVLSSERISSKSKRWTILVVILFAGAALFGGRLVEQSQDLIEQAESTGANLDFRAKRKGGNALVANLNKAVFVPLLATIPFPTMVTIEGQNIQQLQNGGYFIKNILSFFVVFALLLLLPKWRWRNHVLIIAFTLGYMAALGLSSFAQSGRFHHPLLPMEMILGAYGINLIKNARQAKWFDYFLVAEFFIIIFWNWFKLRGRGMV